MQEIQDETIIILTSEIRNVRDRFERNGKKGSINYLIEKYREHGGIVNVFGSKQAFLDCLKKAGYSKSTVSEWRTKLKF
jgi:hypothetical protein